ncbi:bifunctional diaminohydroxyphosphoribosylaminopyrimidine deaminase/5-amino-6-(5-phosphoribosylamino)uracil reductase RibD [Paucibacter sp. TC2R-5]|uniref:bifunctional diaminohydroxyphosphoribosylaminopyrimidine deaminase/5-amino-6-(5-phosphoribosylamino)uracil reductase RibD n=1 Tax=Paucibacter sp. TC2R-5 TaxID=2893555 RepID=UPI0021E3B274|nr:bifunctional diaminohydroxyphosphoribosylaminopyrimidine deaminase/5-amino-6-(5-phosphoribosylamino)uracil reductase RibD [Paucibacter sp. TC2R-5]MCV2361194.1 bifunctional diaminohydroxyphosphoribosylaminopyrimidine deaminase/5-amino-6-(5-phosphoribosylamino)uracil reductase RibD [Paucibacter sp. TC2R-5]
MHDSPIYFADDLSAMRHALALAEGAIGLSDPNPRVGCVIVATDGRLLGSGHTQAAGAAHAEVMALRDAQARGADLQGVLMRGATAFVTLEPCSHHGRTPPCCEALIGAGLARVVAAIEDPNPQVAGQGMARLAAAGLQTSVGLLADEARELNIGFFTRMQTGLPFVRMKIAASMDGRTALLNGRSQWITSSPARSDGHAWRRRAGAILTGIGTLRDDNPRLDVRLVPTALQPLRVVIDSRLETPVDAQVLAPPGEVLIYCAIDPQTQAPHAQALRAGGATLIEIAGAKAKVDLAGVLRDLGTRGVNELHIEAGHKLNGSLLREGLVDELLVYMAPKLLGPGLEMAALGPFESLQEVQSWRWLDCSMIGEDLRLRARPRRD